MKYSKKDSSSQDADHSMENSDHSMENSARSIEIPVTRKVYQILHQMNSCSEFSHILEHAHHVDHDQKHHLEVPLQYASSIRHTIDGILRRVKQDMKKGRGDYGTITEKNLQMCLSKLHGQM